MSDENGPEAQASDNRSAADGAVLGNEGNPANWATGLQDADNRSLVEKKNWKTPDDAMKSYRELETHTAKSLRMPGENATTEDWDAFYQKMGRPEKPEGYEFKLDVETVPESFPYDENSVSAFRTWAHAEGLSPKQAQGLHDKFVGYQAEQFKAAKDVAEKREGDAHRDLVKTWGEPDSEDYQQKLTLASRAIHESGAKDELIDLGVMSADGAIRAPNFLRFMAKIGAEQFQEDSGGGPGNPASDQQDRASRMYGATTPLTRG